MSVAPDGGWGWVVTFSAFMINGLVNGIGLSFGIFFTEYRAYFGSSSGETQLLGSLANGISFMFGPVAGMAVNKFNCRRVGMFGAILSSLGLFLSTFSPSLDVMILLYGVIMGVGFALMYMSAIVMVSSYFTKRRAFATGMAVSGTGIGSLVIAPLSVTLIETYGWKGATWILSGILLNGVVFAALFRPLESDNKSNTDTDNDNTTENPSFCNLIKTFICSLFTNLKLMIYILSCSFVFIGFYIPFNFLPALATDLHMSASEGALLISIIGISNTVTKVVIGKVSDQSWADCLIINSLALMVGGAASCFVSYYRLFGILAVYSVVFGAVMGIFIALLSVIVIEVNGKDKLPNTLGLIYCWIGLSSLLGSPLAGFLSDIKGDNFIPFYLSGTTFGVGGLLCLLLRRIMRWKFKRRQTMQFITSIEDQGDHYTSSSFTVNTYM